MQVKVGHEYSTIYGFLDFIRREIYINSRINPFFHHPVRCISLQRFNDWKNSCIQQVFSGSHYWRVQFLLSIFCVSWLVVFFFLPKLHWNIWRKGYNKKQQAIPSQTAWISSWWFSHPSEKYASQIGPLPQIIRVLGETQSQQKI